MCYCSQPKSGINCCRYPIIVCNVCERVMCDYHRGTFGHCLTCGFDCCKKHEYFNGRIVGYCAVCCPQNFGLVKQ